MKKYILIIIALIAALQLNAQHTVHIAAGGNVMGDLPYNNQYDYNWCTVIYPQDMIKIGDTITNISYRLNVATVYSEDAFNQKIYMAHTSDIGFADATYPNTALMTLVYDGIISYREWVSLGNTVITLTTPFAYNNTDNLIIHVENHDGTQNGDPTRGFSDYSGTTTYYPCKYNQQDGSFPATTGLRTHELPNIFLTFAPGLDAGISKINNSNDVLLPGLNDITVNFSNYLADDITSVDIEWKLNGAIQATYNWSGSLNHGQESAEITLATDYDFAPDTFIIKAWTANPNSGVDELNTNDTLTKTILVVDYIEINDNSYSYTSVQIPVKSDSRQGWSEAIYNKDSLLFNSKICGIAYDVRSNGYERYDQSIFFTDTADIFFPNTSMPDETKMTNMHSGYIDYSETGWKKIAFNNFFEHDNLQNLMVYYTNKSGAYNSPLTWFNASQYTGSAGVYNHHTNEFPTDDGTSTTNIPNIRLYLLIPSDAGITALDTPDTYFSTGNNDIAVSLKNFGTDILTSANIKYQVNNGTINTFNWTGSLSCYDSEHNIII